MCVAMEDPESEKIKGREEGVPREIDFDYVLKVFQAQYNAIDNSIKNALTGTNTIQTIRFLLNEYTRSRLIHYDRLNAFLLGIPSISDICWEAQREGSLVRILTDEEQIKEFNNRKEELFAPAVAQSTLFLLKELLKTPIKKTKVLNEHFPPIRELLHTFEKKVNPKKKENFHYYYHPSNLKNIHLFYDKNADLDVTQVFPLFYENDEFYFEFTEWMEKIRNASLHIFDERQKIEHLTTSEDSNSLVKINQSDYLLDKRNLDVLHSFLNIYLREPRIPSENENDICAFLPKILHADLVREIVNFYEKNLPKCFPGETGFRDKVIGGIKTFKCVLTRYYGKNFVTIGYLEFWNLLKRDGVPDDFIDSLILKIKAGSFSHVKYLKDMSFNVFWKKPFLRIITNGKKTSDAIHFSYIQVLDAFFHFLAFNMKSYTLASSRGRGFEEIVAEKIIKELGITPQKIIVYDPDNTSRDEEFRNVLTQSELVTPSGKKIPICKVVPDLKSPKLRLGKNFRWREIDLAFVYKGCLYLIECKNHLLSEFSDFEPIILKRNLLAYSSSYEKRKICKDKRVMHSLNISGGLKYSNVRFMIVSGEECPFEFMLSFDQFGKFMRDFDQVHEKMEQYDKTFVSKSLFTEESVIRTWFEEIGLELVENTLNRSVINPEWSRGRVKKISRTKLAEIFAEYLTKLIQNNQQLKTDDFMAFFETKDDYKYIIAPILKDLHMLNDFLLRVYKFSYKFKELEEKSFRIPFLCLKFCLDVLKKYYPLTQNYWIIRIIQGNLVKSFRNLIVGGRGTGRYFIVENIQDLEILKRDFESRFMQLGILTPNNKDIRTELVNFLETHTLSENKKARLQKFINLL